MDSPFIFDRPVTGKNFIGRKKDSQILQNLILQNENVVISAPPKSGKLSLLEHTLFSMRMTGTQFLVGQMSALTARTLADFIAKYGSAVMRMVASTPPEYAEIVARYLQGTHIVFDQDAFTDSGEPVSFNWEPDENDLVSILKMPYTIARDRGETMIMVITEFQNIALIDDDDMILGAMERVMKEAAEESRNMFSSVFLGSGVNAMKEIFRRRRYFYRLTEQIDLSMVDEKEIAEHLSKGFLSGGKVIDRELLTSTCRLFRCNLYYLNMFVSIVDSRAKGFITEAMLMEALASIIAIHEARFAAIMNSLTTHQVNLLRAIIEGCTRFSGSEVVRRYSLNSSANVKRVKDALMKKEIVTFADDDTPEILDPLFEYWVRTVYFGKTVEK